MTFSSRLMHLPRRMPPSRRIHWPCAGYWNVSLGTRPTTLGRHAPQEKPNPAFVDPAALADGKASLIEIAIGLEDEKQPGSEVEVAVCMHLGRIIGWFLGRSCSRILDTAVPSRGSEQLVEPLPPVPVPSDLTEMGAAK